MLGGAEFLLSTVSHWVSLDTQNMISWDLRQFFQACFVVQTDHERPHQDEGRPLTALLADEPTTGLEPI